jgi:hypothetical protein
MLPERESRPEANQAASISTSIEDGLSVPTVTDGVRCTRCQARLTAARSIAVELGPICQRLQLGWVAA